MVSSLKAFKHDTAAWDRVGGLSLTSKMPGPSYSLPASKCITGSKLHAKEGSVCEKCYALKGRYNFPNVQNAMARRLAAIDTPTWVEDMASLINSAADAGYDHFRWHDSGDLQSNGHLCRIIYIAIKTPRVKHWLPTREVSIVASLKIPVPKNLVIRESCHFVDEWYPSKNGMPTSTVHDKKKPRGHACPANTQGGQCGSCRACWNPVIKNVSYPKH